MEVQMDAVAYIPHIKDKIFEILATIHRNRDLTAVDNYSRSLLRQGALDAISGLALTTFNCMMRLLAFARSVLVTRSRSYPNTWMHQLMNLEAVVS